MRLLPPPANLLSSLFLLPALASAFLVTVPASLAVGRTVTVDWTRHKPDPSKFSVRLRKLETNELGVLQVVDSQGKDTGKITLPDPVSLGAYIVEIFREDKLTAGGDPLGSSSQIRVTADGTSPQSPATPPADPAPSPPKDSPTPSPTKSSPRGGEAEEATTRTSSRSSKTETRTDGTGSGTSSTSSSTQVLGGVTILNGIPGVTVDPTDSNASATTTPDASGATNNNPSGGASTSKIAYIIGGILGGVVLLLLVVLAFIITRRRARRRDTTIFYREKMVRSREDMAFNDSSSTPYTDMPAQPPEDRYQSQY